VARPKSYTDLIVWQKVMDLARLTYQVCQGFPGNESYGLIAQTRRAAVSVPSNIAEGHGRLTDTQFRYFLGNARGSLFELQTQMRLAADLGYISKTLLREWSGQSAEVGRLLNGLIASLGRGREERSARGTNPADSASTANSAL
jgi:four helix bundle protein